MRCKNYNDLVIKFSVGSSTSVERTGGLKEFTGELRHLIFVRVVQSYNSIESTELKKKKNGIRNVRKTHRKKERRIRFSLERSQNRYF